MWLATPNSRKVAGQNALCRSRLLAVPRARALPLCLGLVLSSALGLRADEASGAATGGRKAFVPAAEKALHQAQERYHGEPSNLDAALNYARACYDLAELPINNSERAEVAHQGIAASHEALARASNSTAAHYYLGLNEGELARTETLGALSLVKQMEREFSIARALDEHLDYAGPDRCLGLLYRDAPSFGSIGSRSKAREHLQHALELAPDYPDNQLNLLESQLKWGEHDRARRDLEKLESALPAERSRLSGPAWAPSWADWDARLRAVQKQLEAASKKLQAPREKG